MPKYLVLGCGGSGCRFVSNLTASPDTTVLTINDSDADICIGLEHGFHGDSDSAFNSLMRYCDSLIDLFSDYSLIFSMSSLGGAIGAGAIEAIYRCSQEAGIPYIPIVTLPFLFESERRKKALEVFDRLYEISDRSVVIDLQTILKSVPDIGIDDISEMVGSKMANVVEIIRYLVPRVPFYSIFDNRSYAIGYALTSSTERSVREALSMPFFDTGSDVGKLILCLDGDPGKEYIEYLREKVTGMTGICPEIIPGRSEMVHGVTVFVPIVFRRS